MDFSELYRKTEIKQIINPQFGTTTETIEIDINSYDYISNFVLKINLPKLTNTSNDTGYINWVDSVGHAIIEGIEFKIGNNRIIDLNMPYGNWLDIYNELTDATLKEWSMIGKNSTIESLQKYSTKQKIYHVPLYLPFTNNEYNFKNQKILPLYLLNSNNNFKLRIKLRSLSGLVLVSSDNTVPTSTVNNSDLKIELYYDTFRYQNSEKRSKKISEYSLSGYLNYFDIMEYQKKDISTIVDFTRFKNSTIKDLIFIFQHKSRNSNDATPAINDPNIVTDVNGNDWFNYTSDASDNVHGFSDPFTSLDKLTINNENEVDDTIDPLYFRNVLPSNYYINKPNKHIYTYPMKLSKFNKKGLITIDNLPIQFKFTTNMISETNFKLTVFATTIKKLTIQNNNINLLDINLDEEKQTLTSILSSGETSSSVTAVTTGISDTALSELKNILKKELLVELTQGGYDEVLIDPESNLASEISVSSDAETTVFNRLRFPAPIFLGYKLNILLYNDSSSIFLVFSEDSHLNMDIQIKDDEKLNILKQDILNYYKNTIISDNKDILPNNFKILLDQNQVPNDLENEIYDVIMDNDELKLFIEKIKQYNSEKYKIIGNIKKYNKKTYLHVKDRFYKIKNREEIQYNTIKTKLNDYFIDMYKDNKIKKNVISSVIFNLFGSTYNEFIGNENSFKTGIQNFIEINQSNIKILKITLEKNIKENDFILENKLKNDVTLSDAVSIIIEPEMIQDFNGVLLISEINTTAFEIKKKYLEKLVELYNSKRDDDENKIIISQNVITIDSYSMDNIFRNIKINFKSKDNYKLVVEQVNTENILFSETIESTEIIKLNERIPNIINERQFISIIYNDNYGNDDSFVGALLITVA